MNTRVLVVDDDEKLNSLLTEYLTRFGFHVTAVNHPVRGLQEIKQHPPDVIILDVMLPGMDGFELCREIRKFSSLPIIMLTARGEVTDRIVGLELGADDYMPKPFEPRELVARIQSVLRRGMEKTPAEVLRCDGLTADCTRRTVTLDGQPVELTTMEFELLALFMHRPGLVFSRERLMDELQREEWEIYDRSVDVLVSRLRRKLQDNPKHPRFIKAVWGSGYKFIGTDHD
jgi:DNA-binding response OmpR family regulator